ncbi:MAG: protein phosphatase CheZ [bacterium]
MENMTKPDRAQLRQMATQFIAAIDENNEAEIDQIMLDFGKIQQSELFQELGRLTRDFHDSLNEYEREYFVQNMAEDHLPNAGDRLEQVIALTEEAAHKTLSATEKGHGILTPLTKEIGKLADMVSKLDSNSKGISEVQAAVNEIASGVKGMQDVLQSIVLAQSYQDLSGQIVRKVVTLITGVHLSLVSLLGEAAHTQSDDSKQSEEAPLTAQEDVDALLESLGF